MSLGNDELQDEEMGHWTGLVGKGVATGLITSDLKDVIGKDVST